MEKVLPLGINGIYENNILDARKMHHFPRAADSRSEAPSYVKPPEHYAGVSVLRSDILAPLRRIDSSPSKCVMILAMGNELLVIGWSVDFPVDC